MKVSPSLKYPNTGSKELAEFSSEFNSAHIDKVQPIEGT